MPPRSSSDSQIEIEELLHAARGKSGEVPTEIVNEIMDILDGGNKPPMGGVEDNKTDAEIAIKIKMMDEKDWRKKSALAAMLISRSLDY